MRALILGFALAVLVVVVGGLILNGILGWIVPDDDTPQDDDQWRQT